MRINRRKNKKIQGLGQKIGNIPKKVINILDLAHALEIGNIKRKKSIDVLQDLGLILEIGIEVEMLNLLKKVEYMMGSLRRLKILDVLFSYKGLSKEERV